MEFGSENIVWVKNVKRNGGSDWAYANATCGNTFLLNWPTSKKGSALTPKVGDIIVLFQRPNHIDGRRNYKVHLTHLVTPVSDRVVAAKNNVSHKWCREVRLIAKAVPIDAIPNPGYFDFFLPNRGLTNPIRNVLNTIGLDEIQTQERLWYLFQNYLCSNSDHSLDLSSRLGAYGEIEGDIIAKEHIRQELRRRNSAIVRLAKYEALAKGGGKILCECCGFDFQTAYGEHGEGFIECHHKVHISDGERITTIQDLAMVCSNCHRMLHKRVSIDRYLTVEELRDLILQSVVKSK